MVADDTDPVDDSMQPPPDENGRKKGGKPAGSGKTSERAIRKAELHNQVLNLRKQGWGYNQIGAALGFSRQRAHEIVTEELNALIKEPAAQVLELELQRLETLLQSVAEDAEKGDGRAIETELRIRERRGKLLGIEKESTLIPLVSNTQPLQIHIIAVPPKANGHAPNGAAEFHIEPSDDQAS